MTYPDTLPAADRLTDTERAAHLAQPEVQTTAPTRVPCAWCLTPALPGGPLCLAHALCPRCRAVVTDGEICDPCAGVLETEWAAREAADAAGDITR